MTAASSVASSSPTLTKMDSESVSKRKVPPHWHVVASQALVTPAVLHHHYHGSGTKKDPFVVEFIPNDPRDPMNFSQTKKWSITMLVAVATLAVAFVSSAYTGGVNQIILQFGASEEVVTLGVSLFVLGVRIFQLAKSDRRLKHVVVCNWPSFVGPTV